jgi:hypothetical protein
MRDRDSQQKEIEKEKENKPSGKKMDVSKTRLREILR